MGLITVEGKTIEGACLRPSDWAERLVCGLSLYTTQQLIWVRMIDGCKGLIIDKRLEHTCPEGFTFVMDFIKENNLRFK